MKVLKKFFPIFLIFLICNCYSFYGCWKSYSIIRINYHYYDHARDFALIRNFLMNIFSILHVFQYFIPSNIENNKYGTCGTIYTEKDDINLSFFCSLENENPPNSLIAISFFNFYNMIMLEVHPNFKEYESEIISQLEIIYKGKNGNNSVSFVLNDVDTQKEQILTNKNYKKQLYDLSFRIRALNEPIPDVQIPKGFTIRNIKGKEDYPNLIKVVGTTFEHCRQNMTIDKIIFLTQAEFYHQDLDLIVVNPEGEFVAFTTIRLDKTSGIVEFEPVGIHPRFRRMNLSKALVCEGLKRLIFFNPKLICLTQANNDEPPDKFYNDMNFNKINLFVLTKKN